MISAKEVREKQKELFSKEFHLFENQFQEYISENPYARSFSYSIQKEKLNLFIEMLSDCGYVVGYEPPNRFLEYVEVKISW